MERRNSQTNKRSFFYQYTLYICSKGGTVGKNNPGMNFVTERYKINYYRIREREKAPMRQSFNTTIANDYRPATRLASSYLERVRTYWVAVGWAGRAAVLQVRRLTYPRPQETGESGARPVGSGAWLIDASKAARSFRAVHCAALPFDCSGLSF